MDYNFCFRHSAKILFMQAGVDAFVIWNNKFLLILRDDIPSIQNPNMWNLPGGGIEDGETEFQAMMRELKEEINLTPRKMHRLETTSYPDGNVVTKFFVFLEDEEKKKLKLGEGQKMDFFTLEEATDLPIIPNLREYIQANHNKLHPLITST